jgi:hypothetical protein
MRLTTGWLTLLALFVLCGAVAASAPGDAGIRAVDPAAPWTGQWTVVGGGSGDIALQQVGTNVTGTYVAPGTGRIAGTVSGNVLTGTYADEEGGGTGTLAVTMSADLQSFEGQIEATSGADAGQHAQFSATRRVTPPPPPPPVSAQPPKTLHAREGTYRLRGIPACLRSGSRFQVTLSFTRAKRKGNAVLGVRRAVFTYQGRSIFTDKSAPFRVTILILHAKAGKSYVIRARASLAVRHGPSRTRLVGRTVKGC